ncbi:signal peptidase II [Vallitalea guaymasensis]|uniref:Lipoprotein signal peptidase n=1 Tax=Vallitalea guaymasensis TaxID=1185412 RepID=A0A8J8MEF3_9FIRM|nr:signal peptidase II [Vallitalea guaymasensis]QUH31170.1 signal peptidase II [Vallitalea guaymasensis]
MMKYLIIAPLCFLIDQICKIKAVNEMDDTTCKPILKNNILLKLNYNEGAFLGFLKNKKGFLLLVNILSVILLICLSVTYAIMKGNNILTIGLAFLTGGALSNVFDRIRLKKVVDYFSFKWKPDLIFNLADMFVFLGCILLIISEVKPNS